MFCSSLWLGGKYRPLHSTLYTYIMNWLLLTDGYACVQLQVKKHRLLEYILYSCLASELCKNNPALMCWLKHRRKPISEANIFACASFISFLFLCAVLINGCISNVFYICSYFFFLPAVFALYYNCKMP